MSHDDELSRLVRGEGFLSSYTPVPAYPILDNHVASAIREHADAELADTMHEAVMEVVREFQASLANDEEVGAALASFGQQITISVTSVSYRNPHLMIFKGIAPDGKEVDLVQHTSQVNLLLTRVKVSDRKPHRIGFDPVT